MSERPIKLLLIDPDPIYRTGLRIVLEKFPELQVVAEAESGNSAWQTLSALDRDATSSNALGVDLILSELHLDHSQPHQLLGLQLCQKLKTQYSSLPLLLLTCHPEPSQLAAAQLAGVEGYCCKGIAAADLVSVIRQVAAGRSHWFEESKVKSQEDSLSSSFLTKMRDRVRLSGMQQIDSILAEVTARLQYPGLPILDRAFLAGQRRELLASRWLVNQLLPAPPGKVEIARTQGKQAGQEKNTNYQSPITNYKTSSAISTNTVQDTLITSIQVKLQSSLENLTRVPLEIDILSEEKKRQLLHLILNKIEDVLAELRSSQVQISQLDGMRSVILQNLWQEATTDFFGRYSTILVGERAIPVEIVNALVQDATIVKLAILDKIPLVVDLFSHLLFATPLIINNNPYAVASQEASERAEIILENLLIQLANAVVQPLLNRFPDVEIVKQNYYCRRLISTREVERFRNDLSWKYRVENYINAPKNIFESRYEVFLIVNRGLAKTSIYASRTQELAKLSGIPLLVTLILELRDAIAPRLRAGVSFLGSGVVYLLTQVIGRAIGLIGRGILQGLGGSLQESKNKRL